MLSAEGRVIMVSGASRGIGKEIVARLLSEGYRVSAGVRDTSTVTPSERLSVHRYDASEVGTAESWVEETVAKWGALHGVVNAAGINPKMTVLNDGEEALAQMWEVNVLGPLRVTRAAVPHLAKCGDGRIVNIGSLAGKRVMGNVGYAMTKFAVTALTHGTRRETREMGIRATVICPGLVSTEMGLKNPALPPEEMSSPKDIAYLVETVLRLPNNAAVSELLVHSQFEPAI